MIPVMRAPAIAMTMPATPTAPTAIRPRVRRDIEKCLKKKKFILRSGILIQAGYSLAFSYADVCVANLGGLNHNGGGLRQQKATPTASIVLAIPPSRFRNRAGCAAVRNGFDA